MVVIKLLIRTSAICLLLTAQAGHATAWENLENVEFSAKEISNKIERLMTANQVKGLAVALIKNGEVQHISALGKRMVEKNLPLEADTIIYGASLTKATFAYLVMQLLDEGLINLDASIATYLPQPLPEYDDYRDLAHEPRWKNLTLRILLNHTTGFANFRVFDQYGDYSKDGKLGIYFDPGSRYAYSGEGYQLAQFVLEEGLGLDVAKEMQTRIFDRFGMTNTSMTWQEKFLNNYSHNYTINGENIRHAVRNRANAAGSMDTTLADWSKFLAAVARGEGLNQASRQEMLKTQIRIHSVTQFPTLREATTDRYENIQLGYGLGWGVFKSPFGKAFFKEGHDDGTANYALCIDPVATCILLMSNSVRAEGIFKELVDTLIGDTQLPWHWEGYIPYNLADDS